MKTIIGFLDGVAICLWTNRLTEKIEQGDEYGIVISTLFIIYLISILLRSMENEKH